MIKKIIISISVLILLGFISFGFWFLIINEPSQNDGSGISGFFSFLPGRGSVNPNGNGGKTPDNVDNKINPDLSSVLSGQEPLLRLVHKTPVSGFVILENEGSSTITRLVERGLGHVYDVDLKTFTEKIISNTTIETVVDGIWNNDGSVVLLRQEGGSGINNYLLTIKESVSSDGENIVEGKNVSLPNKIVSAVASPKNPSKFFFIEESGGSAIGRIVDPGWKSVSSVFQSPLIGWLSAWPNDTQILLTTKPSGVAPGFLYSVNSTSGSKFKVLGDVTGLTVLSDPDFEKILYSESVKNGFKTYVFSTALGESTTFPLNVLPEKCVWSSKSIIYCAVTNSLVSATYPDDWYKGKINFTDEIWRINADTQETQRVVNLGMDVTMLSITQDESMLLFIDKNDSLLWSLRLDI